MDSSLPDWCVMVPHCSFDLHFSDNEWCWASFPVFVSHLYVFFGEMSVRFFGPYFDWFIFAFVYFCFCYPYLGKHWKNIYIATMSKNVVWSSTFKSLFLLYFCKWYKKVIQLHSSACSCPVFPTPFIEEIVFSPTTHSGFLSCRFINQLSTGLFLASLFYSIDLCVCFCASTILFDYYRFVIYLKIKKCDISNFVFLSQVCSGYLGSF